MGYQLFLLAAAAALAILAVTVHGQTTPLFPVACELNVLIILDRSDSVKGGFNKSRKFVTDVSEELQIGPNKHRVAMIVYSGLSYRREVLGWNFAKSNEEFVRITNGLRAIGGTTNTKKALEVGLDLLAQRNVTIPTLVMVVTDGRSADDPKGPGQLMQKLQNTWVFAAATGDPEKVDTRELMDITGNINHIVMHRGRDLATDITRRLLREAQDKCRTTTTSTTTTTTTTTTNPITGCEMDLVLVIDFSTTTDPVYGFYKDLSKRLVQALKVSPRHTQVAVVTFATVGRTKVQFSLKKYENQQDVVTAIDGLKSRGGTTAIGAGIQKAMTQSDENEGARPGIATKVMVVFTDGWNNKGVDPVQAAKEAERAGYEVYVVAYSTKVEKGVQVNKETLAEMTDEGHSFTDLNYQAMIDRIKQRNMPCMN